MWVNTIWDGYEVGDGFGNMAEVVLRATDVFDFLENFGVYSKILKHSKICETF